MPWDEHVNDCFGFNCFICRDDGVLKAYEERLMTSAEILEGSKAYLFNIDCVVHWKSFEEKLNQALAYYRDLD